MGYRQGCARLMSHAAVDLNYSRPAVSPPLLIRQECGGRDGVSGDASLVTHKV